MVEGDGFLSMAIIPLLMFVVLMYYALRLLLKHDTKVIRGNNPFRKLKNEEMYIRTAGQLMIFLAAGSLVMLVILYFNALAAVIVICIWVIVFSVLWRRMDDKYGEKR